MRERSPAENLTVEQFLARLPADAQPPIRAFVESIRAQKQGGQRPLPSSTIIDQSNLLSKSVRYGLLDKVASLVDENYCGRSEMCIQFARLLGLSLRHVGLEAREVIGTATYYVSGKKVFDWDHAWVRIGREVVDGNVDVLFENPSVPDGLQIKPYWGDIAATPSDRKLREDHGAAFPRDDSDIHLTWWPELRDWLNTQKT